MVVGKGRLPLSLARVSLLIIIWIVCNDSTLSRAAEWDSDFTASSGTSIEVVAEHGIEWQQDTKCFIARGNASLSRGKVTVRADTLMAYYHEQNMRVVEIYKVQATGHVYIISPNQTASGEVADYTIDNQLLRLIGHPARLETLTETLTASDVIEYHETQRNLIARGIVRITTREGRMLQADAVTAYLVPLELQKEKKQHNEIIRLTANGNVRIETEKEVIRGEHGTYNTETGLATLTGSVKITRNSNQLNGEHAIINLKTGQGQLYAVVPTQLQQNETAKINGRVRLLFVPEK